MKITNKDKKELLHSMFVILFIIAVLIIIIQSNPFTINLDGHTITEKEFIYGDVKDFLVLANRFSRMNTYDKNDFNCVNYSSDLKDIADELGFKVKVVRGCENYVENASCHVWLRMEVDLEPQTMEFVDYTNVYPFNFEIVEGYGGK